jgi:hypothetical protein
MKLKQLNTRKSWRSVLLGFAVFCNPFGFDVAFSLVMKMTGSYWITDAIFYGLSLMFFGLYYWYGRDSNKA